MLSTKVLPPVRCFTCNAIVGGAALRFKDLVDCVGGPGLTDMAALGRIGVTRTCCRTVILSWIGVGAEELPWPLADQSSK